MTSLRDAARAALAVFDDFALLGRDARAAQEMLRAALAQDEPHFCARCGAEVTRASGYVCGCKQDEPTVVIDNTTPPIENTQGFPVIYRKAQDEPSEPVAWCHLNYNDDGTYYADSLQHFTDGYCTVPLYTHPPRREPLTDEEIKTLVRSVIQPVITHEMPMFIEVARAVERAHGIGGKDE